MELRTACSRYLRTQPNQVVTCFSWHCCYALRARLRDWALVRVIPSPSTIVFVKSFVHCCKINNITVNFVRCISAGHHSFAASCLKPKIVTDIFVFWRSWYDCLEFSLWQCLCQFHSCNISRDFSELILKFTQISENTMDLVMLTSLTDLSYLADYWQKRWWQDTTLLFLSLE